MSKFSDEPIGTAPMSEIGSRKFYDALPAEKKLPAIILLSKKLNDVNRAYMKKLKAASPDDWYVGQHFGGGMFVRNYLRRNGFGEAYWPIWNLDDIYVFLLEDAIDKEV
jgi:hypothetical protein